MTFIKERTKVVWEEKLPKVNFCSAKLFPEVVVADQPCRGGGGQLSKSFFTKFCLSNWFHPDQNWLHRPRPHDQSLDRPHVRHQYRTYDWSHDWNHDWPHNCAFSHSWVRNRVRWFFCQGVLMVIFANFLVVTLFRSRKPAEGKSSFPTKGHDRKKKPRIQVKMRQFLFEKNSF